MPTLRVLGYFFLLLAALQIVVRVVRKSAPLSHSVLHDPGDKQSRPPAILGPAPGLTPYGRRWTSWR